MSQKYKNPNRPQGPDHQYLVKDKVPGPYWSFGKAGRPEQGTKGLATSNDLLRNDLSKTNLHNGGTCVFGTGLRNNVQENFDDNIFG